MSYSAATIAYAFVKRGIEEGNPVTQMKLQKLVYFAHGVHLATYNQPLIREVFQAWRFGPVVPGIYRDYKFYGSSPIDDTRYISFFDIPGLYEDQLNQLSDQALKSIKVTWDGLKDVSAVQLSNWTHKVGSPWQINYIDGQSDIVIPNDQIEKYFKDNIISK